MLKEAQRPGVVRETRLDSRTFFYVLIKMQVHVTKGMDDIACAGMRMTTASEVMVNIIPVLSLIGQIRTIVPWVIHMNRDEIRGHRIDVK